MARRASAFTTKDSLDPSAVEAEFSEIYTNITDENVAPGAGISVEKLALSAGQGVSLPTSGEISLTEVIPQDFVGSGSSPSGMFIQRGFHYVTGDGTNNSINVTITFPVPFGTSSKVSVNVALAGTLGSNPTSPSSMTGAMGTISIVVSTYNITNSTFIARVTRSDAKLTSGTRYGFCWIAVGDRA